MLTGFGDKQIPEKQCQQQKSIHLRLSNFKNCKEIGTKLIASHKQVSGKIVMDVTTLAPSTKSAEKSKHPQAKRISSVRHTSSAESTYLYPWNVLPLEIILATFLNSNHKFFGGVRPREYQEILQFHWSKSPKS